MTSGHGADPHPPRSSAPCRVAAAAANYVESKVGAPLSHRTCAAASRRFHKGELLVLHLSLQSRHTFRVGLPPLGSLAGGLLQPTHRHRRRRRPSGETTDAGAPGTEGAVWWPWEVGQGLGWGR